MKESNGTYLECVVDVDGCRSEIKRSFSQEKQIAWAGLVSPRLADSLPDIAS